MSRTGPYNDTPFQIDYEGAQVELTFEKTTPDMATLNWNIPIPFVGCGPEGGAYNGIVITLDRKSVENRQRPIDGTFYTPDPTANLELHAGDKIGDAVVVGAFYDDITTTTLNVPDIQPNTAYYFSSYAVDKQGRYFRAGSHAYALDWAKEHKDRDYPAYQELRVLGIPQKRVDIKKFKEPDNSILHSQWTGLDSTKLYYFHVGTDTLQDTVVELRGDHAQTHADLVREFNHSLSMTIAPSLNGGAPNVGSVYVDIPNNKAYSWTGATYEQLQVTFSTTPPDGVSDGSYWVDSDTGTLSLFVLGAWEDKPYTKYHKPFNQITSEDYWINGETAAAWEGSTWCKRTISTTPFDPSLEITPTVGDFWFNVEDGVMYEWDSAQCWKPANVLYYQQDPSTLIPGALWYAYETHTLYELSNKSVWEKVNATYAELPPKVPHDLQIWVDVKNEVVKRYNFTTRSWDTLDVLFWHEDPQDRKSCDKWWKSVDGIDQLFVWDFINNTWVEVRSFVQQATDPRTPILTVGHIWNRTDGTFFKWDGMAWVSITAIELTHDPRTPLIGEILFDGEDWAIWNGMEWDEFEVIQNSEDPSNLPIGELWFDLTLTQLKQLNVNWTQIPFSIRPQVPKVGEQYFDTIDKELKEWKNGKWTTAQLPIRLTINELNNLMFIGSTLGSNGCVKFKASNEFNEDIKPYLFPQNAVRGHDAASSVPSYVQEGVGTDGSADERREVINSVLTELGQGGINVELKKHHMERAINSALETLRQKSSSGYRRGFMFIDAQPENQNYVLTNRNEGYDKIVTVHGAYRMKGGRMGAYSYNDPFEQSMMQQLYYAGSFDLLSYHLLSSYNELLNEMFANNLNFSWNEYTRTLMLHQFIRSKERILLDVMVERTEQDLLTDRYTRPWLIKFTTAKAMMMLSQIRGKFGSLPGAGGGVSLNSADLASQAQMYMDECMDEIEYFVVNNVEDVGGGGSFILG